MWLCGASVTPPQLYKRHRSVMVVKVVTKQGQIDRHTSHDCAGSLSEITNSSLEQGVPGLVKVCGSFGPRLQKFHGYIQITHYDVTKVFVIGTPIPLPGPRNNFPILFFQQKLGAAGLENHCANIA